MPEATVGQRIVRAKKTLTNAGVPFEVPEGPERAERLSSVLEVIYLIFNEGYSATAGDDWMRPDLCADAMRLGRILAGLMPKEPEVHGLVALMEIQASRTRARTGAVRRARAVARPGPRPLGPAADPPRPEGAAAGRGTRRHARPLHPAGRDRGLPRQGAHRGRDRLAEIAALYAALAQATPSPIVELNRAVALSMAFGPAAGLEVVDTLIDEPALRDYHLLPSVRGDLLAKLGRADEARAEFERAAALTRNTRERALLLDRAAATRP